ncbi:MAG: threonine synthase [Gemmatimonadetes bacterium]|nr:threonine synthase [Gemmatimonadota bacterium]
MFSSLADDGGLFVPSTLPDLRWPPKLDGPSDLRPAARWAASGFFPSLDPTTVDRVVASSLDFPVPLVEVERGRWILELFHGPTLAFKDVGARFLAALMEVLDEAAPDDDARVRTILVATSGDTGGAVASAFLRRGGHRVVALFPKDGISGRQRRQMTTLGENVTAVAVDGTFDDCQRLAREAFRDGSLSRAHRLTSANSINVGRLLPQCFYYLHAAAVVPSPRFVVPAGNLGNLCAGLMAWRAGMPAAGFVAATNENRGFVDYLGGAPFEARSSIPTSSSAMDVGDPSNFERIRWLFGDDERVRESIRGAAVVGADVERCIADLHHRTGYVADPHTAVAYTAATRHNGRSAAPVVVLATAHPAKFPETVERAIGEPVEVPSTLRALEDRKETMRTMTPDLPALAAILEDGD